MFQRSFNAIACAGTLAAMAACSSTPLNNDRTSRVPAPPGYSQSPQGSAMPSQQPTYGQNPAARAEYGTVRTIEVVPVDARPRSPGVGAVIGAVIGAVVGNQVGSGSGRAAATIAGAVGGGLAGNAIEGRTRRDNEVFRVAVRFDDGIYREFDFQRIDDLQVGERVRWDGSQFQRM